MESMTVEEARRIVGEYFVGLRSGVAYLDVGGILTEHSSLRRAFVRLERDAVETEKLMYCDITPWWYRDLVTAGYSPIEAVRAFHYSEDVALSTQIPVGNFIDMFVSLAQR